MSTTATRRFRLLESAAGFDKIDREAGVIYGVRVCGSQSRNGRRYLPTALEAAIPLYEGVRVNLDHYYKPKVGTESKLDRPIADRWGVLRNVRMVEGSLVADLHYLKTHPITEQLLEAAERFPDTFGLSHDASGDVVENADGKNVVSIYKVNSVDVVTNPATNQGLFESENEEKNVKSTIRAIAAAAKKAKHSHILEAMIGADPMVSDMPVEYAEEASAEDQVDAAFRAAVMGVVDDETLDTQAKLDKIKTILGARDAAVAAVGGEQETTAEMSESYKAKISELETKLLESEARVANESVRRLLIESNREISDIRVQAVLAIPEAQRKALVESWQAIGAKQVVRPKQSKSALQESEQVGSYPASFDDFKKQLA